jgi:hypothetical protein
LKCEHNVWHLKLPILPHWEWLEVMRDVRCRDIRSYIIGDMGAHVQRLFMPYPAIPLISEAISTSPSAHREDDDRKWILRIR